MTNERHLQDGNILTIWTRVRWMGFSESVLENEEFSCSIFTACLSLAKNCLILIISPILRPALRRSSSFALCRVSMSSICVKGYIETIQNRPNAYGNVNMTQKFKIFLFLTYGMTQSHWLSTKMTAIYWQPSNGANLKEDKSIAYSLHGAKWPLRFDQEVFLPYITTFFFQHEWSQHLINLKKQRLARLSKSGQKLKYNNREIRSVISLSNMKNLLLHPLTIPSPDRCWKMAHL